MTVKEKIQEYLEYKGVSPTAAERELNWGVGALTKAKSITVDRAKEFLLLYRDLSAEWLLRDEGMMLKSSLPDNIAETSSLVEELKAEVNMLKGENRILRELNGLGERKGSSRSASCVEIYIKLSKVILLPLLRVWKQ